MEMGFVSCVVKFVDAVKVAVWVAGSGTGSELVQAEIPATSVRNVTNNLK